jgi:hypothetical protein
MATENEIYQKKKNKPIKNNLVKLIQIFNENNIGIIPMIYPVSKNNMIQISKSIKDFKKIEGLNIQNFPIENRYIINQNLILLIKGKRIELVLEKSEDGLLKIIYSSKKFNEL